MQLLRVVMILAAAAAVAGQYLQERYRLPGCRRCPAGRRATATRLAAAAARG